MLRQNDRGKVRRRAKAADADSFAFQLFEPGDSRLGEYRRIVVDLHAGDKNEVMPRQSGLDHLPDAHEWRIAAGQRLNRQLPAAQKYRLDVEAVFLEQSGVLRHPDVALTKTEGGIAEADFL